MKRQVTSRASTTVTSFYAKNAAAARTAQKFITRETQTIRLTVLTLRITVTVTLVTRTLTTRTTLRTSNGTSTVIQVLAAM